MSSTPPDSGRPDSGRPDPGRPDPAAAGRPLPPELDPRGRGRRGYRSPGSAGSATGSAAATLVGAPAAARSAHPGARRFARALSWVATVTAMIVLFGSGGAYLYINQQFSNIRRTGKLCLKDCKDSPTELGSTQNFLLVGSDSRAGDNSTGNLAGTQNGSVGGARSDTTLLVHISADRGKVTVVSFPRDLLVDMPSLVTKTGATIGGYKAKFNAAYAVGQDAGVGAAVLVKQVTQLTNLPVDHYVEIDFSGFEKMVDALRGVTICLTQDTVDPGGPGTGGSGFHGTKGTHSISGATALAYVRQRYGLPNGDLDRIARQQRFLASITRKVKSAGTLLNPFKLNAFISAVTQSITLDPQTTQNDLLDLASNLRNLDPSRVSFYTVPTAGGGNGGPNVGDYLSIDVPKAHTIFQAVHDDEDPAAIPKPRPAPKPTPAAPSPTGPPLTVPPAQVNLTVSNGSGITGKGRAVTTELANLGFPAELGGDAQRGTGAATEIHYGSGRQESAQTLAAAVPGATLVADETGGSQALTLIVGTSYAGVRAVTVGTATTAPITPTMAAPSAPLPSVRTPPAPRPKANFTAQSGTCGP